MPNDVKQIVELYGYLKERDSGRNDNYLEVLEHYSGDYLERKKTGFWSKVASIFSPKDEDEEAPPMLTPINLTRPAILNKVAFMGLPPSIRVPEPPLPNDDEAIEFADKQEKAYMGHWKFANGPRRFYDLAWFLGAFGAGIVGVWPDILQKRPRIFTRSPMYFYPLCKDEDGMALQSALWVEQMTGYDIFARWQNKKFESDRKEYEVIQYMDEEKMCVIVDQKQFVFPPVQNVMGVVPIVIVSNIGVPGSPFGDTDTHIGLAAEEEINYRVAKEDEMADGLINPTVGIRSPLDVPPNFQLGQGGTITYGEKGAIELIGPMNVPQTFFQSIDRLQQWHDMMVDNPAALRSEQLGSIVTGKGFNAMLSPLTARLQIRRSLIDPALEIVNRHLMNMWHDFPEMQGHLKMTGNDPGTKLSFSIEVEPAEFEVDGKMWTENEVFLTSSNYIDRQGTDVEIMQLYQNELISWDSAVEALPYTQNKRRERQRIDRDRVWKAQGMAIANQAAQSPMTANPDLGQQERTAYGMERGFLGEMPPMPGPEGQMPTGGEMPMGAEMPEEGAPVGGDVLAQVADAIANTAKLKGKVWVGMDEELDLGVTVYLENMTDKATIVASVTKAVPDIMPPNGPGLNFLPGPPKDTSNAQLVYDPTAGEEMGNMLPGEEVEAPAGPELDEAAMEQLGSMLGGM